MYLLESTDLVATLREIRAGLPERVPLLVGGAATLEIEAGAERVLRHIRDPTRVIGGSSMD